MNYKKEYIYLKKILFYYNITLLVFYLSMLHDFLAHPVFTIVYFFIIYIFVLLWGLVQRRREINRLEKEVQHGG